MTPQDWWDGLKWAAGAFAMVQLSRIASGISALAYRAKRATEADDHRSRQLEHLYDRLGRIDYKLEHLDRVATHLSRGVPDNRL